MVYNKTKRGLEKASSIVGVVLSVFEIIGSLYMFIIGVIGVSGGFDTYYSYEGITDVVESSYVGLAEYYVAPLVLGIIFIALSILELVFCAKVISNPVKADGSLKNRTATRVCMLVFTILMGNWVAAGLMIAVLCLKDYVEETTEIQENSCSCKTQNGFEGTKPDCSAAKEFAHNLLELKHLHKIAVLDDASFKKAVQKVVDEFVSEK